MNREAPHFLEIIILLSQATVGFVAAVRQLTPLK
jgi:hypothetical protein